MNEGLGLVYERFVLNDYLLSLTKRYPIRRVLEAPAYGMAGITGINSIELARAGCSVTVVDEDEGRIREAMKIWEELGFAAQWVCCPGMKSLPFPDRAFDLAWEWAGLLYLADAESLLRELARVSGKLLFVAMPNPRQPGYIMRKYFLEPEFFKRVDERWVDMERVKEVVTREGFRPVEEGFMDTPPWPDTVMPAAKLLERLGIKSQRLLARFSGSSWNWNIIDYYSGKDPTLKARVMRYAFLENSLPRFLKSIWAHHRFVLFARNREAFVPHCG